jgi:teichuronic acid biosynthesis glycosyltransferase TuaC
MRVLVLTNMYPSEAKPTYGVFVRDQVDDLRELGVNVEVLAFEGHRGWNRYARAAIDLRSLLRSARFDLIHAHYGLSGALALAQRQVPVITTFHGSDTYISWHRIVSWFVARRVTPIFVSADRACSLSLPEAIVIPSAVDTVAFKPMPQAEARRAIGWDNNSPYVLFPGARSASVKRFDLFEQVVELAKEARPNLVAVCLEDFKREEIPLVMNAVDVTVLTSDGEGSPVAVRESLACTTPVVSVPVGDVPEVIKDLPGCFIASRDARELAQRVIDAIRIGKMPELRVRAEDYSREQIASRLFAVYEEVVSQRWHPGRD